MKRITPRLRAITLTLITALGITAIWTATADESEGVVTLREVFNYRADWPSNIKVTEAITVNVEGEDHELEVGSDAPLTAVTSRGVKVKIGEQSAYLPLKSTSLVADIEAKTGKKLARTTAPEPVKEVAAGGGEAAGVSAKMARMFPEKLINAAGEEVDRNALAGKFVGVYFSAQWCPPCRAFTPSLVDFRNDNADDFEVVFVSSDRGAAAQKKYMTDYDMKFLATKNGTAENRKLSTKFGVRGIPMLAILAPNGDVVSTNGRGDLMGNKKGALDAWKKKAGL